MSILEELKLTLTSQEAPQTQVTTLEKIDSNLHKLALKIPQLTESEINEK